MRTVLIITLLFALALPCLAELTPQDLEKISNLIDGKLTPIKVDIAMMKEDLKALDNRVASLDNKIAALDGKMAAMATKDDIIATRQNLTERMDTLYGVTIGVLVAIIVAILTIIFTPFLKIWLERREQTEYDERLQRIEAEIEAIKKAEEERKEIAKRIVEEKPEFAEAYRIVGLL